MEERHHHLMYAIFALQVFTQSQTALFVSHIVETAREQVWRLVMTVTQTMEMDAVLNVQSSQTIFEVEDQYHLQIRVQHALPDYKEYGQGTYYTKNGDKYTGEWDDWKGQGEIKCKDGKKYTGHWNGGYSNKFKRYGLGILYSADGQVLNRGKWGKVQYVGKE